MGKKAMSEGMTATLKVSSTLEHADKVTAATGAMRIAGPAWPLYFRRYKISSNAVRDVIPTLESKTEQTPATTLTFGPELLAMIEDIVRELIGLKTNFEDDWEQPSTYAYERALDVLPRAYSQLRLKHPGCDRLPEPFLSTDSAGGVRTAWRWKTRQIRVNFGAEPDLRSYIYFESPTEHAIEELQETTLADRLYWLIAE
jgi:hypothetical protein